VKKSVTREVDQATTPEEDDTLATGAIAGIVVGTFEMAIGLLSRDSFKEQCIVVASALAYLIDLQFLQRLVIRLSHE
jgi:hypothetical protein